GPPPGCGGRPAPARWRAPKSPWSATAASPPAAPCCSPPPGSRRPQVCLVDPCPQEGHDRPNTVGCTSLDVRRGYGVGPTARRVRTPIVNRMVAVRRLTDRALDPIVACGVIAFCLVVTIAIAQDSTDPFNGWTVVLIVVIGGCLAFRRRAPEVALGVSGAGLALYSVGHYAGGPIYLVPLVLVARIASEGDRRRTIYAAGATMLAFVIVGVASDGFSHLPYLLAMAGWLLGAVFLGTAHHNRRALLCELQQRAKDLEENQEEEARRRVAEERIRIARDLHDVIAHGVAAIHLQAGAALHVLERQPDVADPALATIRDLSKQTLDELRATVGVLRSDALDGDAPRAPTPGIRQLDVLVNQARHAGLAVELQVDPNLDGIPAAVDV